MRRTLPYRPNPDDTFFLEAAPFTAYQAAFEPHNITLRACRTGGYQVHYRSTDREFTIWAATKSELFYFASNMAIAAGL